MRRWIWVVGLVGLAACTGKDSAEDPNDVDGDGVEKAIDCDDNDAEIGVAPVWFSDIDGDGWGTSGLSQAACARPEGFALQGGDCDDRAADVHPEAPEVCNERDDDCDREIDNHPAAGLTFYADADRDGFGDPATAAYACAQPNAYVTDNTDCDDAHNTVYPGAPEICDSLDNDCGGGIDNDPEFMPHWWEDNDADLVGSDVNWIPSCVPVDGYSRVTGDCDDTRRYVKPHAVEFPGNGIDENCDGRDYCTDLNCDNFPEIVFTKAYDGSSYIVSSPVFFGNDTAWPADDAQNLPTLGAHDVLISDLNVDGYPDLIFANSQDGLSFRIDAYIYWNEVTGFNFSRRTTLPIIGASGLAVADFNRDGWPDLVVTSYQEATSDFETTSYVYLNSEEGFDATRRVELPTTGASGACTGDLNRDGWEDLVILSQRSSSGTTSRSTIYWNSASGLSPTRTGSVATLGAAACKIADLDADTLPELIIANNADGGDYSVDSYIYWGYSGLSESARSELPTFGATGVDAADIDNDGFLDIVFSNAGERSTDDLTSPVFWGSADGYSALDVLELPTEDGASVTVRDVDGDGWQDILFSNYYNGSSYRLGSTLFWGTPDQGWEVSTTFATTGAWAADIAPGYGGDFGVHH